MKSIQKLSTLSKVTISMMVMSFFAIFVSCNKDKNDILESSSNDGGSIISSSLVKSTTSFVQNCTFEIYTATSCSGCPAATIDLKKASSSASGTRIVPMEFHNSYSYGGQKADEITPVYSDFSLMASSLNVTVYPTTFLNRNIPYTQNVSQVQNLTSGTAKVGIALSSTLSGNLLKVNVQAAFVKNASEAKIVVYLLEDGIVTSHANGYNTSATGAYSELYQKGDPIQAYTNNDVVRATLTKSTLGDVLPDLKALDIYTNTYSLNLSSAYKTSNLKVVAMVIDSKGALMNAQSAKVGSTIAFQINP